MPKWLMASDLFNVCVVFIMQLNFEYIHTVIKILYYNKSIQHINLSCPTDIFFNINFEDESKLSIINTYRDY